MILSRIIIPELTVKDQSGQVATLKANIIEEDDAEDFEPLGPKDFYEALSKLSALGLAWTADRVPRVVAKNEKAEQALFSDEFEQIQKAYPGLPRELSAVLFHALTGMPAYETVVGDPEALKEKVSAVRKFILNSAFRAEFFFKYALKVPYFENIDWEVVFKTHERNVEGMPAVGYALLLLTFHNTNANISALNTHQNLTVAVDLPLVDKLIRTLEDVKTGLNDVEKLSQRFAEAERAEDKSDGTNK